MRYRVIYFQCLCYLALPLCIANYAFDTLCSLTRCVSVFSLFLNKFLVFEAAIYANKDVYNNRRWGGMEKEWEEDR